MRRTLLTHCLLRSRCTLARRGHGGVAHAQKELERLALMEQAMMQPAAERARQAPPVMDAAAAAYLRALPNHIERARAATVAATSRTAPVTGNSSGGTRAAPVMQAGALREEEQLQVSNLTQFLSRCKQLKIRYSSDSDAALRRRGREALCSFWSCHAASAVGCCYQGVREVGFVADYGLADTGMHLDLRGMWVMLRVLKAESAVASSVDATRILHYLSRELQYMERGSSAAFHKRSASRAPTDAPSPSDLLGFRQALTDLAVELLAFYFVVHNPSVNTSLSFAKVDGDLQSSTHSGSTGSSTAASTPPSTAAIASAIDALSGLEVLAVVSARDASQDTIRNVWEQCCLWSLRRQREPAVVAAAQAAHAFPPDAAATASSRELAQEVQHLLVAELFRFAALQRRDLRLTDVVHGFALVRIHLHTLWPPYAQYTKADSPSFSPAKDGKMSHNSKPTTPRRLPLWYEKDTLFRVTWGLAVALVSKDRKLVSSYHFVKIVATLAKLPAFVLSPTPAPKKELLHLELPGLTDASGATTHQGSDRDLLDSSDLRQREHLLILAEIPPDQRAGVQFQRGEEKKEEGTSSGVPYNSVESNGEDGAMVALRPADFWRFIIAKACVFVPNMPPEQRRVVCRGLHLAITEKRAGLFREGEKQGPRAYHPKHSSRRGKRSGFGGPAGRASVPVTAELSDDVADIILPLVEEMSTYTDNYDACILDTRTSEQHDRRQSTAKRQNQKKKV